MAHFPPIDPLMDPRERADPASLTNALQISELLRTQAALQESELRYRQLIHSLPGAVYTTDASGHITSYNKAAAELWGLEPELGKDEWYGSWRLYRPDGSPLPLEDCPMAVTLREGRAIRGEEIVIERLDGTRCNVLANSTPILDAAGLLIGTVNMLADVSVHRQAEQVIRFSEERLHLATRTGKIGIWEWDIPSNCVMWTDSLYEMYCITQGEFNATVEGFTALVHPEDRSMVSEAIRKTLEEGAPYELEFRALRSDGEIIWLFTNAIVLRDGTRPIRMIGATMDVSERKRTEIALRASEERYRLATPPA